MPSAETADNFLNPLELIVMISPGTGFRRIFPVSVPVTPPSQPLALPLFSRFVRITAVLKDENVQQNPPDRLRVNEREKRCIGTRELFDSIDLAVHLKPGPVVRKIQPPDLILKRQGIDGKNRLPPSTEFLTLIHRTDIAGDTDQPAVLVITVNDLEVEYNSISFHSGKGCVRRSKRIRDAPP